MIVFAHIKFGLVRIQGSEVKRGVESANPPPWSERVFEILVRVGLSFVRFFHPERTWSAFGHPGANECSPGDKIFSHQGCDTDGDLLVCITDASLHC